MSLDGRCKPASKRTGQLGDTKKLGLSAGCRDTHLVEYGIEMLRAFAQIHDGSRLCRVFLHHHRTTSPRLPVLKEHTKVRTRVTSVAIPRHSV